jgi:ribosome-associated heat shock protein Hsp15
MSEAARFDVVLHELRLFPSRSAAAAAIQRGTARLNGRAVKPSHAVRAGDVIAVEGTGGTRAWELLELPRRSMSKVDAQSLLRARARESGDP